MASWLFYNKGDFQKNLNGPEIRYTKLAEALTQTSDSVTIAGKSGRNQQNVSFLPSKNLFSLFWGFITSDIIVLQGGNPLILFQATISKILGKKVILDAYAPHWLELFVSRQNTTTTFPIKLKIAYNLFRTLYSITVFDAVLAANKRQFDLYRGLATSTGNIQLINKIHILEFGCDKPVKQKNRQGLIAISNGSISDQDTLIGWVGGLWEWFDYRPIIRAIIQVAESQPNVKMLFFGVSSKQEKEILTYAEKLSSDKSSHFAFLPRTSYEERLDVWSGLDAAFVWSSPSIENDYASRTRNFDCISARLPIIQNQDDYWGPIIEHNDAGITTTEAQLSKDIALFIKDRQKISKASENIASLYEEFKWQKIACRLKEIATTEHKSTSIFSMIGILLYSPFLLLNIMIYSNRNDT